MRRFYETCKDRLELSTALRVFEVQCVGKKRYQNFLDIILRIDNLKLI